MFCKLLFSSNFVKKNTLLSHLKNVSGERSVPRWPAFPTSYERMDVLLPGENRRSTLAGVPLKAFESDEIFCFEVTEFGAYLNPVSKGG